MSMSDSIERTGKTVDDVIAAALSELRIQRDEAEIEIIDAGTRGILGIGAKPARVVVKKLWNPETAVKTFLKELSASMGVTPEIAVALSDKHMDVTLSGANMGIFIGKHGQTLDALQYLLSLIVNKGDSAYISVSLDTENYRKKRKETLEALAVGLAKKVKQTKKNVTLEPMTASERRVIHATLQGDKSVSTFSEGDEPFRNVVIAYKRYNSPYKYNRREEAEGAKENAKRESLKKES